MCAWTSPGKPHDATTGSHLLVRRTLHCSARSASHRRSKGRFGARQKPSSACATSSTGATGATGAACAADAAADPRRYLRAVGRRHRAQATAGRPTCSAPAREVSKVWPLSIIQWARDAQRAHRPMAPHLPSLSRGWVLRRRVTRLAVEEHARGDVAHVERSIFDG